MTYVVAVDREVKGLAIPVEGCPSVNVVEGAAVVLVPSADPKLKPPRVAEVVVTIEAGR